MIKIGNKREGVDNPRSSRLSQLGQDGSGEQRWQRRVDKREVEDEGQGPDLGSVKPDRSPTREAFWKRAGPLEE